MFGKSKYRSVIHNQTPLLGRTYPIHLVRRAGQPEKFRPAIRFFKNSQSLHGCKPIHTKINSIGAVKHTDIQVAVAHNNKSRSGAMARQPSALMRRKVHLSHAALLRLEFKERKHPALRAEQHIGDARYRPTLKTRRLDLPCASF